MPSFETDVLVSLSTFLNAWILATAVLAGRIVFAENNFADAAEYADFHDIGRPSWYWELSENPVKEIGGSRFFYLKYLKLPRLSPSVTPNRTKIMNKMKKFNS